MNQKRGESRGFEDSKISTDFRSEFIVFHGFLCKDEHFSFFFSRKISVEAMIQDLPQRIAEVSEVLEVEVEADLAALPECLDSIDLRQIRKCEKLLHNI